MILIIILHFSFPLKLVFVIETGCLSNSWNREPRNLQIRRIFFFLILMNTFSIYYTYIKNLYEASSEPISWASFTNIRRGMKEKSYKYFDCHYLSNLQMKNEEYTRVHLEISTNRLVWSLSDWFYNPHHYNALYSVFFNKMQKLRDTMVWIE